MLDVSEACFTLHDLIGDAHLAPQAGRKTTSSMGSMSCAMTTSAAFLALMRAMMWLRPNLAKRGFLERSQRQCQGLSERDDERGKGVDGPLHPSPSPQQQTQQQKSNGPSSPASTGGGTYTIG